MNENQIAKGIVRAILYLTLIGLGLYAIHLLRSLIVFIAIAAITSLIGRPITVFLKQKLKFGNTIAVVSTMSILVILLFVLCSVFFFVFFTIVILLIFYYVSSLCSSFSQH